MQLVIDGQQGFTRPLAFEDAAQLRTDLCGNLPLNFVRLNRLARKKFQDGHDGGAGEHRKSKRAAHTDVDGVSGSREVAVLGDIDYPGLASAFQDPSRQTFSASKARVFGDFAKRGESFWVIQMPQRGGDQRVGGIFRNQIGMAHRPTGVRANLPGQERNGLRAEPADDLVGRPVQVGGGCGDQFEQMFIRIISQGRKRPINTGRVEQFVPSVLAKLLRDDFFKQIKDNAFHIRSRFGRFDGLSRQRRHGVRQLRSQSTSPASPLSCVPTAATDRHPNRQFSCLRLFTTLICLSSQATQSVTTLSQTRTGSNVRQGLEMPCLKGLRQLFA